MIGGVVIAFLSSFFLKSLVNGSPFYPMRLVAGIITFAFLGDMFASLYKRKFKVKDFSNLIPGHGGFIDRFDSLIAGGTFVTVNELILS